MKPNRITVSRTKRGTTIKATGVAAQVLFDKLAAQAKTRQMAQAYPCTVHFEDHGQDFLTWEIDATGTVVESMQAFMWVGARLAEPPQPGRCLRFTRKDDPEQRSIRYPVLKVVKHIDEPPASQAAQLSP